MTLEQIKEQHPLLPVLMRDCFAAFGCEESEQDSRLRCAIQARAAFIVLVRKNYHHSFTLGTIGKIMAVIIGRERKYDHATVINAIKVGEDTMLLRDPISQTFRDNLLMLKKKYFPLGFSMVASEIVKPLTSPVY